MCQRPGPQLPLAPNLLLLKFSLIQEKAAPFFQLLRSNPMTLSFSHIPHPVCPQITLALPSESFLNSNASHSTATTWSTAAVPSLLPAYAFASVHCQHSSHSDPVQTWGPVVAVSSAWTVPQQITAWWPSPSHLGVFTWVSASQWHLPWSLLLIETSLFFLPTTPQYSSLCNTLHVSCLLCLLCFPNRRNVPWGQDSVLFLPVSPVPITVPGASFKQYHFYVCLAALHLLISSCLSRGLCPMS